MEDHIYRYNPHIYLEFTYNCSMKYKLLNRCRIPPKNAKPHLNLLDFAMGCLQGKIFMLSHTQVPHATTSLVIS